MRALFLFLDGVGLGPDSGRNPMADVGRGFLELSCGIPWIASSASRRSADAAFVSIDACLDVPGLPQSGTGQATLFTGENCAALAGRHYGPLPHSTSRPLLRKASLLRQVADRFGPQQVVFANAFPDRYFEVGRLRDRWPVITRCCLDAGVSVRTVGDLTTDRAVAADVTGEGLARFVGPEVPVRTPERSADILLDLASAARLTVLEIFHTDKAGHEQSVSLARAILDPVDRLIAHLLAHRPSDLTIVLTSDHGNLEDLSVRTHTTNPVPLAVAGPGAGRLSSASSLADVTPALLDLLATAA